MKYRILQLLVLSIVLVACGSDKKEEEDKSQPIKIQSSSSDVAKEVSLQLGSNDEMKYDKNSFKVRAGQKVTLTLTHNGEQDKAVMGHNFVLLKQGTNVDEFASKAIASKDNDYIPEGDQIIAHTKMIGGGESTTITFDAPEKGTYDFICSFPGHYALMRGKFIVE